MSRASHARLLIDEQREPMVWLGSYPFLSVPVYHRNGWSSCADLFLREKVAAKLLKIQKLQLAPLGLKWVVYDAWRPRSVQAAVFQHYWREFSTQYPDMSLGELNALVCRYVAMPVDPHEVPSHATGGSVDLGLWNVEADELVPLGTEFDEFNPACANAYFETIGLSTSVRDRRRLMTEGLAAEGIVSDVHEYFHKDYGNQKWALQVGATRAFYGEVLSCERQADGAVHAVFADTESESQRIGRVLAIAASLDCAHPAPVKAAPLKEPSVLVREVAGFADVPF